MDMYMNMCIIIVMNIYISQPNEEKLRQYRGSMSGLINDLLERHFTDNPTASSGPLPDIKGITTADKLEEPKYEKFD